MPSRAEVVRLSRANKRLVRLAEEDFDAVWTRFDLSKPAVVRDALLEIVPSIVRKYGDIAGAMTAEWVESVREARVGTTGFVGVAAPVDRVAIEQTVRAFAGHLWTDQPGLARDAIVTGVGRYVRQPGRETVKQAVIRDPMKPRWARIPTKAKTCEFCLMLAARGAVYASEESAGQFDAWHGGCGCEAVPVYDAGDMPGALAA